MQDHWRTNLVTIVALAVAWPSSATAEPSAQDPVADIEATRREAIATRRTLLTSVLVEGAVSTIAGGLLVIPDANDQAWRYAGINTVLFGVANMVIGWIALLGISNEEDFVLAPGGSPEARSARLLRHALADEKRESVGHAINLGLGLAYAAVGGTAILASQLGVDHRDRWLASGVAVAIQAAFLVVVDLWGLGASGAAHQRLLAHWAAQDPS